MTNKIRYPRSSARPIYLTVTALGLLGLAGVIVMLIAMADVPKESYFLLIIAFGLLIVALVGALAVLLATNTRRPWGIDPNFTPPPAASRADRDDAYGETTEDLLRHAVQLPDGKGYGRRQTDDPTVVRRLAPKRENDDRPLPLSRARPAWALEMLSPKYPEEPAEAPAEKPTEQPSQPPTASSFPEVPLDQLDLLPATPDATDQDQDRANGGGEPTRTSGGAQF
jgi:hypothetical protein